MNILDTKLSLFANNEILQKKLESSMGKLHEGVALSFFYNSEVYSASINGHSTNDAVKIGCLVKSLTSTLIAIAQVDGHLQINRNISEYLSEFSPSQSIQKQLENTKIYHLLNHTSGFDCSLLNKPPKTKGGLIDIEKVFFCLENTAPISPPGIIYNYSSIGFWIAAAILEKVYSKSYTSILNDSLFKPLGITIISEQKLMDICPSTGGDLCLSATDLMSIVQLHLFGNNSKLNFKKHLHSLRSQFSSPSPTWSLRGESCYPAWYDYGNSFGHLGYSDNSSSVIRFIPRENMAVIVTATQKSLGITTLGALFNNIFEDFRKKNPFNPLNEKELKKIDTSLYVGTFENSKFFLVIDLGVNGSLSASVYLKNNILAISSTNIFVKRYLKQFTNNLFTPTAPENLVFPILQFSHPQADGRFHYISTNKYIFFRTSLF